MGQDKYYNDKAEQEALKKAFEIIKVYYPANTVCASDSVYDHDWMFAAGGLEKEISEELFQLRLDKRFAFDDPVYSQNISYLLNTDSCECHEYKYAAEFSAPYKGMIMCLVMPKDRKVGLYGTPSIFNFLFRFENDGEIYQINKSVTHFD
ncbi:MAG: hypothetical protein K2J10_09270 [Muribaculaceae bacterium]|nr:hypothetical protein [Muribaculaceae bacterium]